MARIPYVGSGEAPKDVAELFSRMEANGAPVLNLWKMAANAPTTLPHLIRLGNALLSKGELHPRLREMAILRVAETLGCEYEKRAHIPIGREAGMSEDQVRGIADWRNSGAFDQVERAVLGFTDEVAAGGVVKDQTFATLQAHLDARRMMELAETIGFYGMLARILLSFRVDPEAEVPASASGLTGRLSRHPSD